MSQAVVSQVTVTHHAVDMFAIFLGKKRIGYVRRYQPDGPAPISWLPKSVGGIDIDTTTRIAILEKVRELMAAEWEKHEAELQRLRDLENGVVTTAAPAEEPAE
jgi:hypothetical protein